MKEKKENILKVLGKKKKNTDKALAKISHEWDYGEQEYRGNMSSKLNKKIPNYIILAKPSGGVIVESRYFQTCQLAKNYLPYIFFFRKLLASFSKGVIHKRGTCRIYGREEVRTTPMRLGKRSS